MWRLQEFADFARSHFSRFLLHFMCFGHLSFARRLLFGPCCCCGAAFYGPSFDRLSAQRLRVPHSLFGQHIWSCWCTTVKIMSFIRKTSCFCPLWIRQRPHDGPFFYGWLYFVAQRQCERCMLWHFLRIFALLSSFIILAILFLFLFWPGVVWQSHPWSVTSWVLQHHSLRQFSVHIFLHLPFVLLVGCFALNLLSCLWFLFQEFKKKKFYETFFSWFF